MKKISRLILVVAILLAALSLGSSQSALAIEKQARDQALASAAFIAILDQDGEMMGSGSGTFISADGLILTNFHVVGDPDTGELYHQNGLVGIGVIEDPTEPAIFRFYAQVVVGDPSLDLAVVRVVSYLDGDSLPGNLNLTYLPLGDSETLGFGDDIISIGFPGIGIVDEVVSLTYTEGIVAGFVSEGGTKVWIKTDALTGPGNSGGMVTNDEGEIIGVHTAGSSDPQSAARISLERPINLAYELIRKAQVTEPGQPVTPVKRRTTTTTTTGDAGDAVWGEFTFATDVDSDYNPIGATDTFDSGVSKVYAVYQYEGMEDGQAWSRTWYLDGEAALSQDETWDDGESGNGWLNIYNNGGLPDGAYDLVVWVGGEEVQEGSFTIGQPGSTLPVQPTDEGVWIQGSIVDAATGRGIKGATFVALVPGTTVSDFDANPSEGLFYAVGQADAQGYFQLDQALERGERYSIIIGARGYKRIAKNNLLVEEDSESPLEMTIELQKGR
ncbi:MAG: serine protease [Anaerolineales bacterium]|nr:MAG: serine protease [Anaerolineales bacterium]